MADREAERRVRGSYIVGGFFIAVGLCALVFDPMEISRRGLPMWLLGSALVLCGVGLIVAVRLRL